MRISVMFLAVGCAGPAGELVLDYTLFVDGAVQVAGIGASADGTEVALVTDFESVILVDAESGEPTGGFDVPLRAIPTQGATEAVAFLGQDVVVLYPEEPLLRRYAADGTLVSEIVPDVAMPGDGLAQVDGVLWLTEPDRIVGIDPEDGMRVREVEVAGLGAVAGLGWDAEAEHLWVLAENNEVSTIRLSDGDRVDRGTLAEVDDGSGLEPLVDSEGERLLAISDDSDMYNAEPGPIRLYLR